MFLTSSEVIVLSSLLLAVARCVIVGAHWLVGERRPSKRFVIEHSRFYVTQILTVAESDHLRMRPLFGEHMFPKQNRHPDQGVTEQRPLRRVRRQWRFICKSDDSFTKLMTDVMEANRGLLRATQPLRVGDSENLGLIWLRNGRVYNLHTIKVRDKFIRDCNETTMNLVFKLTLEKPYVVFDLTTPFGSSVLAGGQLTVKTDSLDVDIGLITPKVKNTGENVEPQVPFVDVRRAHNLRLVFTGMPPATTAVTSLLALLQQMIPSVQTRLFAIILTRILRNYVATTPMPF